MIIDPFPFPMVVKEEPKTIDGDSRIKLILTEAELPDGIDYTILSEGVELPDEIYDRINCG